MPYRSVYWTLGFVGLQSWLDVVMGDEEDTGADYSGREVGWLVVESLSTFKAALDCRLVPLRKNRRRTGSGASAGDLPQAVNRKPHVVDQIDGVFSILTFHFAWLSDVNRCKPVASLPSPRPLQQQAATCSRRKLQHTLLHATRYTQRRASKRRPRSWEDMLVAHPTKVVEAAVDKARS